MVGEDDDGVGGTSLEALVGILWDISGHFGSRQRGCNIQALRIGLPMLSGARRVALT